VSVNAAAALAAAVLAATKLPMRVKLFFLMLLSVS